MRMHLMKKKRKKNQAVDKFCQTKGMKKSHFKEVWKSNKSRVNDEVTKKTKQ